MAVYFLGWINILFLADFTASSIWRKVMIVLILNGDEVCDSQKIFLTDYTLSGPQLKVTSTVNYDVFNYFQCCEL